VVRFGVKKQKAGAEAGGIEISAEK